MGRPKYTNQSLHGLLIVDKPLGWSSMDICRRVRRAAGNCKTGHAGTLDPLATGVVICCLGNATKQVDQLMGLTKVYETAIDLSAFTNTDDREGEREEVQVETPPSEDTVRAALAKMIGEIEQTPPAYSAIHVNGQRAYKLARKGEDVDIPSRIVRIDDIELVDYKWPTLRLRITCGKGTYIRTIARDLGNALNTGGHLASLRRTAVGPYTIDDAVDEQRLEQPIGEADLLTTPDASETPSPSQGD